MESPTDPALNKCDPGTDVITNSGLLIAGNNAQAGTLGAGDTLMKQRQWGFAPRHRIAWTPISKMTLRAGYGLYYDRGQLFSYLSPSAGNGFNGTFGVYAGATVCPADFRGARSNIGCAVRYDTATATAK